MKNEDVHQYSGAHELTFFQQYLVLTTNRHLAQTCDLQNIESIESQISIIKYIRGNILLFLSQEGRKIAQTVCFSLINLVFSPVFQCSLPTHEIATPP